MTAPKLTSVTAIDAKTIDVTFDQAMLANTALTKRTSYSIEPAIPAYEQVQVSQLNATTVRLRLAVNMLNDRVYLLTASTVRSAGNEVIDETENSAAFVGIGDAPALVSATATNANTIRVVFSEPMLPSSIASLANYSITSEATEQLIPLSAATPIGSGLITKVDLSIPNSAKMTNGGVHKLAISELLDLAGNAQKAGESINFIGVAIQPRVTAVDWLAVDKMVRVSFDVPMQSASLNSLNSFAIISQDGVPTLYYSGVDVADDRKSVKLAVTEPRNGSQYLVVVNEATVFDDYGNTVDPLYSVGTFLGIGTAPLLVRAVSVGVNRLDLYFSERMRDSPSTRDVAHYAATGGLSILKVLSIDGAVIKLATSDQVPGALYTLTIS